MEAIKILGSILASWAVALVIGLIVVSVVEFLKKGPFK